MLRFWTSLALLCATPLAHGAVDEVVQWNKTLLTIVRTAGAQPATVHPTRSFAIMHAAIYDAVNSIDATHESYLVRIERVSPFRRAPRKRRRSQQRHTRRSSHCIPRFKPSSINSSSNR